MGENGLMIIACILTAALSVKVWIHDDDKSILKAAFVGYSLGLTTVALMIFI
jgi:DUF1365 family protein